MLFFCYLKYLFRIFVSWRDVGNVNQSCNENSLKIHILRLYHIGGGLVKDYGH